jgi:hypothetical protein
MFSHQEIWPAHLFKVSHLDGEKLEMAMKEFEQLDRDGIVRPSDSPWS